MSNILAFVKCFDKFTYYNLLPGFKMIIVTFAVILESQVTWSLVAFTSSWRFIYWVFKFLVASVSKLSETVTSQHRNVMVSLPMRMLIEGIWFDVVDSLFSGAWVGLFSGAYMSWIKKKKDLRKDWLTLQPSDMFTTAVFVSSLLGMSRLWDWRITKNKGRERWGWARKG